MQLKIRFFIVLVLVLNVLSSRAQITVLISLDGLIEGLEVEGSTFDYNNNSTRTGAGGVKKIDDVAITRYSFADPNAPGKVMSVGDTRVEYFSQSDTQFPGKISKIGDVVVEHYAITNGAFSGRVKKIGNIDIECYPMRDIQFPGKLRKINGTDPKVKVKVAVGLRH